MKRLSKEEFSKFIDEQEKEAMQFLDKIERVELNIILLDNFLAADINRLSKEEILELLAQLNSLNITEYEQDIIIAMFKHYCKLYYDSEFGFIIFLKLSLLYSKKKDKAKKGKVYICQSDIGLFKIGCSVNPERRIKELGIGSSIRHKIIYTVNSNNMFELEKKLHKIFESKKQHSEWFRLDDKDFDYIKGISNEW